ncbi:hypothetical protein BH10BAC2_BH10BAC2_35520 [soil metagenome]
MSTKNFEFIKRIPIYLIWTLLAITINGCIMSKKATDRSSIKSIQKRPEMVSELAAYAISFSVNEKRNEFYAKDVEDEAIRKKIGSLGSYVRVTYNQPAYSRELTDSNVTFRFITLFGVTEVIYDFAATERNFSNDTTNKKQ